MSDKDTNHIHMATSDLYEDSASGVAYLFNGIALDKNKAAGHHMFRPYITNHGFRRVESLSGEERKVELLKFIAHEDLA